MMYRFVGDEDSMVMVAWGQAASMGSGADLPHNRVDAYKRISTRKHKALRNVSIILWPRQLRLADFDRHVLN
jgi:hypothetical protein